MREQVRTVNTSYIYVVERYGTDGVYRPHAAFTSLANLTETIDAKDFRLRITRFPKNLLGPGVPIVGDKA